MSTPDPIRTLDTPPSFLSEGPAWDADRSVLSWIDIDDGRVFSAHYGDELGEVSSLDIGGPVGAALPIGGGRFLVTLECWIGILHPDGRLEKSRPLIPTGRRFNDAKIDPQGRLVFGSLLRAAPDGRQQLLRLEHDGSITVLDHDLNQSNGMGWSPDGATFYNADTSGKIIYARDYVDGNEGPRRIFADLDGMPDGLTIDAEGNLWITIFDLARIDCYTPDGVRDVDRTIEVPDHHPASVEFIGPDLDELVITTGFPRLRDDEDVAMRYERDGEVLVTSTGTTGRPTTPWAEIPLPR